MIVSFGDRTTEDLYHVRPTGPARRLHNDIVRLARIKLDMPDSAAALLDLASPPGNRLEPLRGKLKGSYSIWVNDQWRIVFRWENNSAYDVRLMDYHS